MGADLCLSVSPCVCLCVFSDVDVEVYKMHNLALPFHQLPFSSCPACLSFPSSTLSPSLPLSMRLVSSLRLFFIFILAFVFIDSQVVWLFHFSFGRKTFDLPPPFSSSSHSHTRSRTPAPAHTQHSFLAPSACHSHSFSRLLSVIGYQWLTRLSFSALYVYVMTIRIDIQLRSAKFTQLLSQLPLPLPHLPYFTAVIVDCI